MSGWIGVDLDSTLAYYTHGQGDRIGEPIRLMYLRVQKWLADGRDVRIFTARASINSWGGHQDTLDHELKLIEDWCLKHFGRVLPITCQKDFGLDELWDDRAVQVIPNTGKRADGNI